MFLMDPALSSDWPKAEAEINRLLQRAEAEVLGIKNWDERKLAYPINRHKRGLYVLSYFRASPEKLVALERDVRLSEPVLRALFIRREKMNEEQVAKSLAADPPKPPSRYDDRGGRWGDRGGRFGDRGGRPGSRAPEAKPKDDAVKPSPVATAGEAKPSEQPDRAGIDIVEAPAAKPAENETGIAND